MVVGGVMEVVALLVDGTNGAPSLPGRWVIVLGSLFTLLPLSTIHSVSPLFIV